jgi:hypothetical protein
MRSSSIKLEKFGIVEDFIRAPCPSETHLLPRVLTGDRPRELATSRSKESAHLNLQRRTRVEGI